MKFIVPEKMTLMQALALAAPDSSASALRSWLKQDRVLVDGTPVKTAKTPLRKNQKITLAAKHKPVEKGVKILYEDRYFVVIDKPCGLLSVATAFEGGNTAHAILKRKYRPGRVHVVHRLDQDTSGVMLFALSREGLERLKKIFEKHDIERIYDAIVEGRLEEDRGTWTSYLYEDSSYVVHQTDDAKRGNLAVTHFSVTRRSRNYSRLILTLETGKKNQIRVHCQGAGTPVTGDRKYGAEKNPIKRLALHAARLSFKHPFTNKTMHFESPPPASFDRLVNT